MARKTRNTPRPARPPPAGARQRAVSQSSGSHYGRLTAAIVAGAAVIAGLLWWWIREGAPRSAATQVAHPVAVHPPPVAQHVDEQQCAECHAVQAQLWRGSHHDLAMQEADASSVLGDFDDATFAKDGMRTRFFQRDARFWINTQGPDGQPADYPVKYTFGVEPLQQYLLELDRGRLQAFTIAWDTQRKRWFDLYPSEHAGSRDEPHWTRQSQNWNSMCAECHSTGLNQSYDASTGIYRTTWKQIDVGCQACHGPAGEHLAWARAGERARPAPAHGFDFDIAANDSSAQIETCARCHSQRASIWSDYRHGKPLMDTHLPALLDAPWYFADGQIEGDVYEYGSLLQSKMHAKGLRCSDCHEPHSLRTRGEDNALCTSCHNDAAPAARAGIDTSGLKHKNYDSPQHHFHKQGWAGSQCIDCHAPPRASMTIDLRHDHSFRIPRPDLSAGLGTPNACNVCHDKRSSQWAADAVAKWYGPDRRHEHTYGETLWAGRTRQPGAAAALAQLAQSPQAPVIVRATALELLRNYPGQQALDVFRSQLFTSNPLMRFAAVRGLEVLPVGQRAALIAPLLSDPVRAVRLDAVQSLATLPADSMGAWQRLMTAGVKELESAQQNAERSSSDRPGTAEPDPSSQPIVIE
ncbi:MAG TPA: multiheme c-type cytochrome [Povalibacter sp.]|nr:multiheme c-type cytochrome [Povalibacter sp.]